MNRDSYIYFLSSLGSLSFGMKPPMAYSAFLSRCADFSGAGDLDALTRLPDIFSFRDERIPHPLIAKYMVFEKELRNEIVKLRATRKKTDPALFLKETPYGGIFFTHLVLSAHRHPSPLEGEKILDQARWDFLEELSFGHYFDIDALLIYASKLLILCRWEKIREETGRKLDSLLAPLTM